MSMRPDRDGATTAMSRAGRLRRRFIARTSGRGAGRAAGVEDAGQSGAGSDQGRRRLDRRTAARSISSRTSAPVTWPEPSFRGTKVRDVVREVGSRALRRERDGPRQAIRMAGLIVVPNGAAGQAALGHTREQATSRRRGLEARRGQVQFRRHARCSGLVRSSRTPRTQPSAPNVIASSTHACQ